MTDDLHSLWRELRSDLDGDADVDHHDDYIAIFPYRRSYAHCKREVTQWAEDNSLEVSCVCDQINVRLTTTPA